MDNLATFDVFYLSVMLVPEELALRNRHGHLRVLIRLYLFDLDCPSKLDGDG